MNTVLIIFLIVVIATILLLSLYSLYLLIIIFKKARKTLDLVFLKVDKLDLNLSKDDIKNFILELIDSVYERFARKKKK